MMPKVIHGVRAIGQASPQVPGWVCDGEGWGGQPCSMTGGRVSHPLEGDRQDLGLHPDCFSWLLCVSKVFTSLS